MDIISELSDAQVGKLLRAMVYISLNILHDPTNMEYEGFFPTGSSRLHFLLERISLTAIMRKYKDVCTKGLMPEGREVCISL